MKKDHFLTDEQLMLEIYKETIFDDEARIHSDIEFVTRLLERLELSSGKIVDLGCGPNLARLTRLSSRFPGIRFAGLDQSDYFIQTAIKRFASEIAEQGVAVQCGVVSDLEDESLAGITLFGNLLSFPEMGQNQQMLAELYRCVSPGGFCVLQLPDIKKWQRMHPSCTEEFALHHETSNGLVTEEGRRTFDADSYVSSGNFVYKDSHDTPLMEYSTTNQLFDLHDSRHGFSIEMMLRRAGFGLVAADPGPVACSPRARGLMSCMINIIGIK